MEIVAVVGFVLVSSSFVLPPQARFEGGLAYSVERTSAAHPGPPEGLLTVWLSPAGTRIEPAAAALAPPTQGRVVTLWRRDDPDRLYLLDEVRRQFATSDVEGEDAPEVTHRITLLGAASVAGHRCERARITARDRSTQEVCVTRELGALPVSPLSDRRGRSVWNQLRRAGLDGVPVSWSAPDAGFSMVLVSAERLPVPPALLEVPAGFERTRADGQFASSAEREEIEVGISELRRLERMGGG